MGRIILETERLVLRDLMEKDKKVMPSLVNDLAVSRYLAVVPYPYTSKDGDWFVNHCEEELKKNPRVSFELGIEIKETGDLIGVVSLSKFDQKDKKATLGYWLSKNYWRRGVMFEAVQRLIKFGFEELGLQRIDVLASTKNEASNNLIKKAGFVFEGCAKRYHCSKSTGKFHDANLYGLLVEDWRRKNE